MLKPKSKQQLSCFRLLLIVGALTASECSFHGCDKVVAPTKSGWQWWPNQHDAGFDEELLLRGLASLDSSATIFATRCGRVFYTTENVSLPMPVYSIGKTVVTSWVGVLLRKDKPRSSLTARLPFSNDPKQAERHCNISSKWDFGKGQRGGMLRTLGSFLSMTSGFGMHAINATTTTAAYSNNAIEFITSCYIRKRLAQRNPSLAGISDVNLATLLWTDYLHGHEDEIFLNESDSQISGFGPSGGLHLSARDAARLGLLYLQSNTFGEVLTASFLSSATTPQVPRDALPAMGPPNEPVWNIPELSVALPFDAQAHQKTRMRGAVGYGFGLWILKDAGAFHLSGQGGNYVIIDPSSGLVISLLHYSHDGVHPKASEFLEVFRNALVGTDTW